jgi:hypothetical protein
MKKLSFIIAFVVLFNTICKAQEDSANTYCYESFFKTAIPVKNRTATNLTLKNGKQRTLASFLKDNYIWITQKNYPYKWD